VLGAADAGLRDLRERLDALDEARREAHELGGGSDATGPRGDEQPGTTG
jgi:hypothetical protein